MPLSDWIPGLGLYVYSLIHDGNLDSLKLYKNSSSWERYKTNLIVFGSFRETLSPLAYAYLDKEMKNEQNRNEIIELLFADFVNAVIRTTKIELNVKNFVIYEPTPLIYALVNKSTFMTNFPDGKYTPTKVEVSMAKDLIQRGADVTIPDYNRNTALMVAAVYNNDIEMAKLIISKNPETLKQRNNRELSVLQLAFNTKQIDIIVLLIQEKADVTEKYIIPENLRESLPPIEHGETYLHIAVMKNFPLIVFTELLKHGIEVDVRNKSRHTPLTLICNRTFHFNRDSYENNFEIIKLLLEYGADPNKDNGYSRSPIIQAVINNHLPMAKLLLPYSKIPVDEIMVGGNKLFNYYITNHRYDWQGVEDQSSRKTRIDMIILLLNYGAKVDEAYINANRNRIYDEVVDLLKNVTFNSTMSSLKHLGITIDPDTEQQLADHLTKPKPPSLPESYTKRKRMIDEISKSTPLTDANVAGKQGSDMNDITPGNLRGAMNSISNASHYLTDKEYEKKMDKLQEALTTSKKYKLGGKKTKQRHPRKNKSRRRHKL
jgi:ankyrin repeat protein